MRKEDKTIKKCSHLQERPGRNREFSFFLFFSPLVSLVFHAYEKERKKERKIRQEVAV